MPAEYAPERHLHVPSQPAAPVKLPRTDAADFRLQIRVHATCLSIAGAMGARVSLHMLLGLTPFRGDLFNLNGLGGGVSSQKEILINVMCLGFFIKSHKVRR